MTAKRLLPLTGIVAVGVIIAALITGGEPPDTDAPISEVTSFYTENDDEQAIGGLLLGFGAALFLFFAFALRSALRRAEPVGGGASALSFAGAIVYAIAVSIFAGLGFTIGDSAKDIDPASLQTLHVLSMGMFPPLAVGTLVFLVGSGAAVLKTGIFPKWLAWGAIVAAIFIFTPLWFVPFIGLGLFVVISSVLLMLRSESGPSPTAAQPPAGAP